MALTVVVLGGAFAGLQIAHRLLKHTRNTHKELKVILVSKVRGIKTAVALFPRGRMRESMPLTAA